MGRERMAQGVGADAPFGPAELVDDLDHAALYRAGVHRLVRGCGLAMVASFTGEEPDGIAVCDPMFAESLERPGSERYEAILVSLAPADVDEHPAGVEVADLEMQGFLQAEAERIAGPEEALQDRFADGGDQLIDFGDREDGGKFSLLADAEVFESGPVTRAGARVEELESGVGDLQGVGSPLLIILDVQQVVAQFVLGGQIGGLAEPLGELADGAEVGLMRSLGESGELQVREHLLGERREGQAFT